MNRRVTVVRPPTPWGFLPLTGTIVISSYTYKCGPPEAEFFSDRQALGDRGRRVGVTWSPPHPSELYVCDCLCVTELQPVGWVARVVPRRRTRPPRHIQPSRPPGHLALSPGKEARALPSVLLLLKCGAVPFGPFHRAKPSGFVFAGDCLEDGVVMTVEFMRCPDREGSGVGHGSHTA